MTADLVNLLEYSFLFTVVSSPVTQAQLDVTSHLKKTKTPELSFTVKRIISIVSSVS